MSDLHGNAPDRSRVALILIDVVNDLEWPGGEEIFPEAMAMADRIAELRARARQHRVPIIYVNDNYGDFTAGHDNLVRSALAGKRPDLVKPVVPVEGCLFLEKVHSAFYSTALEYLLGQLNTRTVVLTGQVTGSAFCTLRSTRTCGTSRSWSRTMPSRPSTSHSAMPR